MFKAIELTFLVMTEMPIEKLNMVRVIDELRRSVVSFLGAPHRGNERPHPTRNADA